MEARNDRRCTRDEQLDVWFTYHPPTDETAPKYALIRAAHLLLSQHFEGALYAALDRGKTVQSDFEHVTFAARKFVEAIDEVCPQCPDATAAVRCVRLARNAMNDSLLTEDRLQHFKTIALQQLDLARYQANSAIACQGV